MKTPRQLPLLKPPPRFFGGRLLHGRRRSQRPLSTKDPLHIVLRSSWAMGPFSLLKPGNRPEIERLIEVLGRRHRVRVYRKAVAGNHIHLLVKVPHRRNYNAFIRALSGKVASHVMRRQSFAKFLESQRSRGLHTARRAHGGDGSGALSEAGAAVAPSHEAQGQGQRFWQFRPFSRALNWGRDYRGCCEYLVRNTLEAFGFIAYRPRGRDRYTKWFAEALGAQTERVVGKTA